MYLQAVLLVGVVAAVVPSFGESGGAGRAGNHGSVVAAGVHAVGTKHGCVAGADEDTLAQVGRSRHIRAGAGLANPLPRPRVDGSVGHYGHARRAVDHCRLDVGERIVELADFRAQPAFPIAATAAAAVRDESCMDGVGPAGAVRRNRHEIGSST